MCSLEIFHTGLELTHGSSRLLRRSHQQHFHLSLLRMRDGEGMVVVKGEMAATIWFHGPTNLPLLHQCLARQQRRDKSETEKFFFFTTSLSMSRLSEPSTLFRK